MTGQIYTDDDFEIIDDHIVRYTGDTGDKSPPTWRVGEAWFRETYNTEYRKTREYDAWNSQSDEKEEVKTVEDKTGIKRRSLGRFIFREHQHDTICEEDRDYILIVAQKKYSVPEWRILDAIRISGRYLDCMLGFGERRKWTREDGSYREIGVPWNLIDPLEPVATYPAEAWETPDLSYCYSWDNPEYPMYGEGINIEGKNEWKTLAELIK